MKVLVIGGCGYIGSKIIHSLKNKYDFTSIDLEFFGNPIGRNIKEDYKEFPDLFYTQYDAIILLAAHSSVGMCKNNLLGALHNNVVNFCWLLQKIKNASKHKSIKFIYASSASVYGSSHDKISLETDNFGRPHNFYDLGKQEIDNYASLTDEIEYYGLRFGTVNGWSPNLRTDIMLNLMHKSFKSNNSILYSNGGNYRPILFIDDLVSCIDVILAKGNPSKKGIYNLLSFNSTIFDIAKLASQYLKCDLIHDEKMNKSTYSFSASSQKFCETFDFKFKGSIEAILDSLNSNPKNMSSERSDPIEYAK